MKTRIFLLLFLSVFISKIQSANYTIYPIPQKIVTGSSTVSITREINAIVEDGIKNNTVERLKEVFSNAGYTLTINPQKTPSEALTNIWIGINGSKGPADKKTSVSRSVFTPGDNKFDPYTLEIIHTSPAGKIIILGNNEGSAFYAMATLEQILKQSSGNRLQELTVEDFAYMQYRGIVEGFYGYPYTMPNRLSLLEYCKRYKMNLYVYGPKGDPYHLGYWRRDYPTNLTPTEKENNMITQDDLRKLAEKASACNVNFVWAAHPAMQDGISFASESAMNPGIDAIMQKFEHLYDLGLRGFGVFIDDINYTPQGTMQAYLADQIQKKLDARYNTAQAIPENRVSPLFFVPTAYALNYGSSYTLNSLKTVDARTVIAFTGYDCFSNIRPSACADMAGRINRNPVMWWNNPVNDDHDDRIYMRKLTTHWTIEDPAPISTLHGLMLNPMAQAQASKIALFGGADYSWNPAAFNDNENWEKAISSISEGNEALRNALRIFALNADALVEPAQLKTLYDAFRNEYSPEHLPAATDPLIAEMKKIYDACVLLNTMKDSENKDLRLLYYDIKYWIAKLESMSDIAMKSLQLLKTKGTGSSWTDYLALRDKYDKLHSDTAFFVTQLEGSGTNTHKEKYEAQPSQSNMMPFINYLVPLTDPFAPSLPDRPTGMQVITNLSDLTGFSITQTADSATLNGLSGISLPPNGYVGIFFNSIYTVYNGSWINLSQDFIIESSVNGKEWISVSDTSETISLAYIRIRNNLNHVSGFPNKNFTVKFENIVHGPVDITTNMKVYKNYGKENLTNNNETTYFWRDGSQNVGDWITLDFGSFSSGKDIQIIFTHNDYPTGSAVIESSADNTNWTELYQFTSADITENNYHIHCIGDGKRYIRFRIASVQGSNWLKVAEFSAKAQPMLPRVTDQNGRQVTGLDDSKFSTNYSPQSAGYVLYRFIENIKINKIDIYHYSRFSEAAALPEISVLAGKMWISKGFLNDYQTSIDVSDLDNISQLKIAWNEINPPVLYEIIPFGIPYIENPDNPDQAIQIKSNGELQISASGNKITILSSDKKIKEAALYTSTGSLLIHKKTNESSLSFPFKGKHELVLINVTFSDGTSQTKKIIL